MKTSSERLVYKYYSNDNEYAYENLKNRKISFTSILNLNDPFEGFGKYLIEFSDINEPNEIEKNAKENVEIRCSENTRDVLSQNCRVFCTSKTYDNPLLWAYYANSHKGFCVSYYREDVEKMLGKLGKAGDIQYEDNIIISKNQEFDVDLLFKKSTCWKHEDEFRAIYCAKSDKEFLLKDCNPVEVYLGLKMKTNENRG